MRILRVRMHDWLRNAAMLLDYAGYMACSLFKFKPFPEHIKKILVIELLRVGDLLAITPSLKALKKKFPQAQIDIVVQPSMKNVLAEDKNVNRIIAYKGNVSRLVRELKEEGYDLGVLFHPGSLRMSLALLLGKVKYRIGGTPDVGILYGRGFFLHKKVKPSFRWQHKVDDNLLVVAGIGAQTNDRRMHISVNKKATVHVKQMLRKNNVGKYEKVVIVHPGSEYETQRWYPERFAEVADELMGKYKKKVVFTGVESQAKQVTDIINKMKKKPLNFVGKTNMQEYVALVDRAEMVVSVDTSIIHIASALNKRIVSLFGPTLPERWGPTSRKGAAIQNKQVCTGCRRYRCLIKTHECMKSITSDQVKKAISSNV